MARKKKKVVPVETVESAPVPVVQPAFEGSMWQRVFGFIGAALCLAYFWQTVVPEQFAYTIPTGPRQPMTVTTARAKDGSSMVGEFAFYVIVAFAIFLAINPLFRNQNIRRIVLGATLVILGFHILGLPNWINMFSIGVALIGCAAWIEYETSKKPA